MSGRRRAFALVTVLWAFTLAGAVALTASIDGRLAVDAARARIGLARGAWMARGCLAHARATAARALAAAAGDRAPERVWRALDAHLGTVPGAAPGAGGVTSAACALRVEALGVRVDVNRADATALVALARAAVPAGAADSAVAALLDWRDADTLARPGGAERAWYLAAARAMPADGPFTAREELGQVRGLERDDVLRAHLDVETARIALLHAPAPVLATLPGLDAAAIAYVMARRTQARPVDDLHALVADAPTMVRARLQAAYAALDEHATLTPDGWRVSAVVTDAASGARVTVEQLFRRSAREVVVTRELAW